MSAVPATTNRELRASDLETVTAQLGRTPSTDFTVVARCSHGHPLVIRNFPYDHMGLPFPTLYWLTCPDTVKAVSRLESQGWIKRLADESDRGPGPPARCVARTRRTRRGGART